MNKNSAKMKEMSYFIPSVGTDKPQHSSENAPIPFSDEDKELVRQFYRLAAAADAENEARQRRRKQRGAEQHEEHDFKQNGDELKNLLSGRKKHHQLRQLRILIQVLDRESKVKGEFPIACTDKKFTALGGRKTVSNILQLAIKVGLLKCTNKKFRYGCKDSYSRMYIMNHQMRDYIEGLFAQGKMPGHKNVKCKNLNCSNVSNAPLSSSSSSSSSSISGNIRTVDVRLSSNLRLPASITDAEILDALDKRYPWWQKIIDISNTINHQYYADNPDLIIQFKPKITRSETGMVTKISSRAYSRFCSSSKTETEDSVLPCREKLLKGYLDSPQHYEYDVHSSIYQVTRFLNTGILQNENYDLYPCMTQTSISGDEDRKNYKLAAMRLYFEGSVKKLYHNVMSKHPELKVRFPRARMLPLLEAEIMQMEKVIGKRYGSEIFLHESCIYIALLQMLLNQGLKVLLVYDCFYSDNPKIGEYCRAYLPRIAENYLKTISCHKQVNKRQDSGSYSVYKGLDKSECKDAATGQETPLYEPLKPLIEHQENAASLCVSTSGNCPFIVNDTVAPHTAIGYCLSQRLQGNAKTGEFTTTKHFEEGDSLPVVNTFCINISLHGRSFRIVREAQTMEGVRTGSHEVDRGTACNYATLEGGNMILKFPEPAHGHVL